MSLANSAKKSGFNINSAKTIFTLVLMPVIGGCMFIVQPGFVQGLVSYVGFSERDAGFIVSAEMTGFALITVLLAFISHRINWRIFLGFAIAATMVGNFASAYLGSENLVLFVAIRFVVGLATGAIVSLGFTSIGMTAAADRNFGFAIMASMIYGAIVLGFLPRIFESVGFQGLLYLFSALAAFCLILTPNLPTSGKDHHVDELDAVTLPLRIRMIAVGAMLCYFLAQGAVWAYIFLFGTDGGLTQQSVANSLTLSQFTGIAGAFCAIVIGARFTRFPPLVVGVSSGIIPILMFMYLPATPQTYLLAVLIYNFGFNLSHPYLLATMAAFDKEGRVIIFAVSAQTIGLAVGPAVGALLLTGTGYLRVQIFALVFFTLSLAAIYPAIRAQIRLLKKMHLDH
jgi:predicted MFS family arabinose efflux permease